MSARADFLARIEAALLDPLTGEPLVRNGDSYCAPDGKTRHPIVRDIPRFVSSDKYVASFSFEWNTHFDTQLDSATGSTESERQFGVKTGFTPAELKGKMVLDAGVGAGRYADIASLWGADLVGVDLSFAVDAAHRNFADRPNVWIAQADIGALPFAPETFDAIFSIGVLHHTSDTKSHFLRLVPLLKPGGTIAIWVYPDEGDYRNRKMWIPYVSKIPHKAFYAWCRWFVPWARSRVQRSALIRAIGSVFPYSNQGLGMEMDILDTFDGYSPKFHGIHSPDEVRQWFLEAGLEDVRIPGDWPTCMRGRKRA